MTLCFPSVQHPVRLFLGCMFSPELCRRRTSPGENVTHRKSGRTLCYIFPYFKRLKRRMMFIKITFFFCSISCSFRKEEQEMLQHGAWGGTSPQIPQNTQHVWRGISNARIPWDHGSLDLLSVACVGKGVLALLPALFISCEQTSVGPCDDAPPVATR